MECVSIFLGPVVNFLKDLLTNCITQKLSNFTSSSERVKTMNEQMEDLEKERVEIEKKMRTNQQNNREIPTRVPGWLKEVEEIKECVNKIPSDNDGRFNLKMKYKAGEDALTLTKKIEGLSTEISKIRWTDAKIPLGRVDSKRPPSTSTSTSGGNTKNVFDSRVKTFNDALKLLQQNDDDAARVIALCGMGGVGKTTMMKQLKEAAEDNKMFKWIVDVGIGNTPNLLKIQKVIAVHTGEALTETDETLMAIKLAKRFKVFAEREERSLVILDDVWKESKIKLEDIGLASPLPKGVKLLLTSRDQNICQKIATHAKSDLKPVRVDVLEEDEARDFFCTITEISAEHDCYLYQIGCDIVRKCGCLPYAIELIAANLKHKEDSIWRSTLDRLKINDLDENVQEIIEISYESLKKEDKAIFLLCGLFPEDSNIPIEDLTRYAWGLKLLERVSTMGKARDRTKSSVSNLKSAYLLMVGDSRHSDCVKMHDLVLAFVVNTVSKGGKDGCGIIHHDDFSKWSEANSMSQSCKQISLTCKGMSEFPSDFKFPNLSLLKLMHGNESLRFPQDFYVGMEKLQVIAFEKLVYPLVPTYFQCASLQTLCLDGCSLMFDLACIGNLSNLEVLSFANSFITILPSTFRNLKKLRLLDVTGCCNLVIDDGVLKSLVKLEELYMTTFDENACCFTDDNCKELAERSENLYALEFEFIGNNAHMKNMSYEKLERFKLSVGCYFSEVGWWDRSQGETSSYQNSLKLVTNRAELLESKINRLFKFTHALYLHVNDMNTLEDVEIAHPPPCSSFNNLRFLVVSECTVLKYLFTPSVAKKLSKLEYLEISRCPIMEAVIHTENNGSDTIKFLNLKYLHLAELPKLLCFCNNVNVIELPHLVELRLGGLQSFTRIYPSSASSSDSSDISRMQSLFNKEDATPKMEKLSVSDMDNLKEIWPPQFSSSNLCLLRELTVKGCDSIEVLFNMDFGEIEQLSSSLRSIEVWECNRLVKLFPVNPMPLFNNLEELTVRECASVQVIFDIDMACVAKMDIVSSRLRSIYLDRLGELRKVWKIKDAGNNLIHGFEAVESIYIERCERFENIFTPATTNFDMRALKQVQVRRCGRESEKKHELVESNQDQEIKVISSSREEVNDDISKVALSLHTFHHLRKLVLWDYKAVEVVFEIMSPESAPNNQPSLILPYLEELDLSQLELMSHVWKCNWNEYLSLKKQQSQCPFHNLTTIKIEHCHSIKYLFSPLMAKFLSNLKEIHIQSCDGIEEVVSNRDDEDGSINSHTTTTFFPRLDILELHSLRNFKFKCIGGGVESVSTDIHDQSKLSQVSWSLGQYAREISIKNCYELSSVIPWYAAGRMQKLQVLVIEFCKWMTEVFETQEINKSGTSTGKSLPRLEYIAVHELPKLKILKIRWCNQLEHVFTFSTLESLAELEELEIKDCEAMEVIVKQDNGEQTSDVVFPRLKSLVLVNLPNFVGFFLGKNEIEFPVLEKVVIGECPQITVFTYGRSTAPKLKFINTSLGKHSFECGLNFLVTTTSHQSRLPSYESTSSYRPTTMDRFPWSYHNLIDFDMDYNPSCGQTLFSSDKLLQLQKLETVHLEGYLCSRLWYIEEIFDSQTVAEIPNLRQVDLEWLRSLKYIWKSNQWTVLKFPNLTRLSIRICNSLKHLFTCSMVGSILQLQELHIESCESMKVIVKGEEEECDATVNANVVFPCLKSLTLDHLSSLEGFCLGKEAFEFPSLDTLEISRCEKFTVFTKGDLSLPKLQAIRTVTPHLLRRVRATSF